MPIIAHQAQPVSWPGQEFVIRIQATNSELRLADEAVAEIIEDQLAFLESLQLIKLKAWIIANRAVYCYLSLEQAELPQAISLFKSRSTRLLNYDLGISGTIWEKNYSFDNASSLEQSHFQQWVQKQEPNEQVSWLRQQFLVH